MIFIKNQLLRKILKIVIPFVLIPAVTIIGTLAFDEKKHIFISLFVAFLALLLFFAGFERKGIGSRRSVIVSVMTALSVVGRLIPFFKPITAIATITGVWLGSESGFLVGALSALLSNFIFGQGPWTPFQMLSWGLIGFFAGILAKLLKNRVALVSYGVICGILFSMVMDVWTVLGYNDTFDITLYFSALLTSLPHTLLYAASNFIFLWFLGKPFGDKLERIKTKYGI